MKKERKKRLRHIAERRRERQERRAAEEIVGTLTVASAGYGFVKRNDGDDDDIFIPAPMVNNAIDGDVVKVELLPPRSPLPGEPERGPAGRVIEIVERKRDIFVGELLENNRIRPLNTRLPDEIVLHGSRRGAEKGDWVKFRLDDAGNGVWRGEVEAPLGRAGVLAADLDAVMAEFHIPARYTAEEDLAAQQIVPREISRVDRRDLFVVTIDPADAKDFDDALSVVPNDDPALVTIGVHISDVAAYIAPKSEFDQAAAKRGFSCYLPGRTLPMLPPALTKKISLQAGQDSFAHTVFLDVDRATGEIVASRREHSLIRVAWRLDYPTVQKFADENVSPAEWDDPLRDALKILLETTRKMRAFRAAKEAFIELPLPEIRILCSEGENKILGLEKKLSAESEQLVEECMLAANSAVGNELLERGIAGIFRVHPEPEAEKAMEFADLMQDGFQLPCGDITERANCNHFISRLSGDPRREVILSALLRSLPRAYYAAEASIHFALGKLRYSHFTSPIRRYPDLTVHQQLWNFDSQMRLRNHHSLEKVAEMSSELEENNDNAYYAASDRLKLRYLEEKLEAGDDTLYNGVISRVLSGGLQVDIAELGIYGFVPLGQLGGKFDRGKNGLREAHGVRTFCCGDAIKVRLAQIDFDRNSAVFVPAGK
ncbi:MAG: ribonuclease R [Victivallaceae bacterium]|nr:ribonuclease R [Victivallaceae bacterium]